MKNLYLLIITALITLSTLRVSSQTIFFEEDFENGGVIPNGWTNEHVASSLNWRFEDGGYTTNDAIPNSRRPPSAYEGDYNALFEKSTLTSTITKLVTPEINLELAIKPELHFFYANYSRTILSTENDIIRIFYRSVDEDTYDWVQLAEFTEPNEEWVEATILIPDSVRFKNVQLAFEGEVGPGWGACIDDIKIIETGIIPKYLESINAVQASVNNIPTGSLNNPILRIDLTVKGNDGNLYIDSLVIDALHNSVDIVPENGVKLYFTTSSYFTVLQPVGGSASFINGKAVFTNIGQNLPFGYSYIWITYDVPVDENHEFNGLKLDGKISKNNIIVNGLEYPFVDLNPSGYRQVNESVVFDDFESTDKWTLTGEFEIGEPQGLGGAFGTEDPSFAQNGNNVLGTDLTGMGLQDGDYENNLTNHEYSATVDNFSCKYYKDVTLQFYRWLNVEYSDSAYIQIDLDNNNNWTNVWKNTSLLNDNKWSQLTYSIKNQTDRQENISLRYTLGPTNNTWTFSGWNIDDFAVTGTFIHTDVGISAWVSPGAGCGHVAPEELIVKVKNFGFDETNDTIPLGYSVDNGENWIIDTLFTALEQDESISFTFSELIDLTTPGENNILVKTFLEGDQDSRNNQFDTTLYILPTFTLPYTENFESNNGFWQGGGENNTWDYGIPSAVAIDTAFSGENCWVTNLSGDYVSNDSSWLESPCFDFSGVEKPMIELMIKSDVEKLEDGLALYYSIDEGSSWSIVPTINPYNWNWYSNPISALGTQGWDSISNNWFMARQTLPNEVVGVNPVKFRLLFESGESINGEGFAVDDIRIYEAPTDAGISAIVSPVTSCFLSNEQNITVTIENFGIRDFTPQDNLITKLDIEGEIALIDTFNVVTNVEPGNTVDFSFSSTINMRDSGNYNFTIYTLVDGDSNIYTAGVSNDTLIQTIEVQGEPDYTLGPDIGTLQPDTVVLDAGAGYSNYEWNDASTNRTLALSVAGTYYVTVTNAHACNMTDSIIVIESVTDLGVTTIAGLSGGCQDAVIPSLELTIMNYGDTTYHAGDTIQVGYQINNSAEVIETVTIGADVPNGNTINYIFTNQPDLTIPGVKNFKCFSVFTPELNYRNDTSYQTIEIYVLPEIDLGQDTIYSNVSSPILLDAGAGFGSYTWQDASMNQTFSITSKLSEKYYVEVEDVNACGTDSDTVWIISDDWILDTILTPTNACEFTEDATVQIRIKNNSENIFSTGFEIPLELEFNETIVQETAILASNLAANSSFNYTFIEKIDISETGEHEVITRLLPEFDIDTNSNEYIKNIENYGIYYVNLGYDTIATKQADTILLDAGDEFASYTWTGGASTQTYQIPNNLSSLYEVTVTDEFNCATSYDSVRIMAYDIGVDEIVSPESQCDLTGTNNLSFVIHNYGNDVIPAGESMKVIYKINEENWVEKPFTLAFELKPNHVKTITIPEELIFDNEQTYDFSLCVKYDNDLFPENDTIFSTIFEFEKPSVELGTESIYTTQPDTITLQAQEGYANYQWQDFSKENYFNVTYPASATYHVIVNNAYGCTATDTVHIYTYDIGIASIDNLNTCNNSLSNNVVFTIKMNSQDTLNIGDQITAKYVLNEIETSETVTLTQQLTANNPFVYTFTETLSIPNSGNYDIECLVEMENEVITNNNSLEKEIRVGPHRVNLGDDINTYEPFVILDAGTDFVSYLWNTEETTQTIEVSGSGKYTVTVTDENSCNSSDSINVLFLNPSYDITEIKGLSDACEHEGGENISFTLKNTGNDTIFADSIIPIEFFVNWGETNQETYQFNENFEPTNEITISFESKADLSEATSHLIRVTAYFGELSSLLDTTINTWGLPEVYLGDDIESTEESVILDAGEGFITYLWNTEEETQSIEVIENGDYWVEVSDENSCTNSDTVNVYFLPIALKVSQLVSPTTGCGAIINEKISIIFKNTGEKVIPSGTILELGYELEENERVNESIEFASNMQPNASLSYEFIEKLTIEENGTYNINFYINYDGLDVDTSTYSIIVYEKPEFFNDNDTIKVSDYPYTLDPGFTAENYLWSTEETTPTITINADNWYSLTITDDHSCEFTDSVYVLKFVGIYDNWGKQVSIYPNPTNEMVNINLNSIHKNTILKITDVKGKTIYINDIPSESIQINTSNWEPGVYIIRLFNEKHHALYQLIKQ